MVSKKQWLDLDTDICERLVETARDAAPVAGLTHNHYKYPARFSPKFVRAAIEAFSEPGDLILDPFVGGGTTLVEALALQRDAVGIDISSLAIFVSEAKTLVLDELELAALRRWSLRLPYIINMHKEALGAEYYQAKGYHRNIDTKHLWRLRKAVEQTVASAARLHSAKAQTLARCIVLRTAQWALDARKNASSLTEFKKRLSENAASMIAATTEFSLCATANGTGRIPEARCINSTAAGIEKTDLIADMRHPHLVLTSPPYPGVHVLYHRWQVDGGRETPAPFWIANKLDGSGSSYYTLGDRKTAGLRTYFENLQSVLTSTVRLSSPETVFIQVVAFAEPKWQLRRYLEVAEDAGLSELFLPNTGSRDHRLWRTVPNRRWYADQMGSTHGSREVVLFHRLTAQAVSHDHQPSRTSPRPRH